MTAREKLAWILLALAAAALAVAAFAPARIHTPATPPASAAFMSTEIGNQLTRIENRLNRLESAFQSVGNGAVAATTTTTARTATTVVGDPPQADTRETSKNLLPQDGQTAATEQRRLAASALVDRAIQVGNWTRKDAEAWQITTAGMRAEDRYALVHRLVLEANNDRLKVDPGATFH